MFGLEFTPSTVVVALIVLALVFLAVRRLVRNGMCDCHKGDDAHGGCAGGCGGCSRGGRQEEASRCGVAPLTAPYAERRNAINERMFHVKHPFRRLRGQRARGQGSGDAVVAPPPLSLRSRPSLRYVEEL